MFTSNHFIAYRLLTYKLLAYYFSFWLLFLDIADCFMPTPSKYSQRLAHRACVIVWHLMQAAPRSFDRYLWPPNSSDLVVCSNKRYRASSSREFTSRGSTTSTNWSNACSALGFDTDNSIRDNAIDERWNHFWLHAGKLWTLEQLLWQY